MIDLVKNGDLGSSTDKKKKPKFSTQIVRWCFRSFPLLFLICMFGLFGLYVYIGTLFFESKINVALVALVLFALTMNFFLVSVPEVTGLILLNQLTHEMRGLRQGLHVKFPWETGYDNDENFFSLKRITKKHSEDYAAWDGPMLKVKYSFQYEAREESEMLIKFIRVDETTIDEGINDMVSSSLSQTIGNPADLQNPSAPRTAVNLRGRVKDVEQEVLDTLKRDDQVKRLDGSTCSLWQKLEEDFGINIKLIAIADIDYSDDYQQMRSGKARMETLAQTVTVLKATTPGLTDKEAVETILVEQGKVKKQVFEIPKLEEGLEAFGRGLRGGS